MFSLDEPKEQRHLHRDIPSVLLEHDWGLVRELNNTVQHLQRLRLGMNPAARSREATKQWQMPRNEKERAKAIAILVRASEEWSCGVLSVSLLNLVWEFGE